MNLAEDGSADAWIDARLDGTVVMMREARLIGRVSTARDFVVRVMSPFDEAAPVEAVLLGSDLRAGDLLAFPCRGVARLRNVDPKRQRLVRDSGDPDPFFGAPHCGR